MHVQVYLRLCRSVTVVWLCDNHMSEKTFTQLYTELLFESALVVIHQLA